MVRRVLPVGEHYHGARFFAREDGRRGYSLEVRVSNLGAIKLYERFGFTARGVRRGYYTDNREDALIMWRDADPGDGEARSA